MERLPVIKQVKAHAPHTLEVTWRNGKSAQLDLAATVKQPAYRNLEDDCLFAQVQVGDWGHSVVWPGDIALGADSLWRLTLLAQGRTDTVAFMDWRMRHGLSLTAAADALGISRRMVAYYASGDRTVPKTVLLACRGWEASHAA